MKHALWFVIFQCQLSFVRHFPAQLPSYWSRLPAIDDGTLSCSGQREAREQLPSTPSTHTHPFLFWRECDPRCGHGKPVTGKLTILTNLFLTSRSPQRCNGLLLGFQWSLMLR